MVCEAQAQLPAIALPPTVHLPLGREGEGVVHAARQRRHRHAPQRRHPARVRARGVPAVGVHKRV